MERDITKHSFTKKEHLRKNRDIKNVFDKGTPFRTRLVTVFLWKRDTEPDINRVGFIIKKHLYKKSVLRNRFRRILRESYRHTKYILSTGYDVLIIATNLKKKTKSTDIEKELLDVFKKRIKK